VPDNESRGQRLPERPDPFFLPSDTPFRFALLIVAVLASSLFAHQMLFLVFRRDEFLSVTRRCHAALTGATPDDDLQVRAAAARAATLCRAGLERSEARWMLLGVACLAATTLALLWILPWARMHRGRFEFLDAEASPELANELASLSSRAGVRSVSFLLAPFDARTSAVTFGRAGARRVVLRGGLVTTLVTNPPAFRAVVLHELAHIRNRDVDQTYVALCVSVAFVLAAVLPFAVVLRGSMPLFSITWRLGALALLVYFLLLALLRSRELYADARAAQWGAGAALGEALAHGSGGSRRRLVPLGILGARHPAAGARIRSLEDPRRLFALTAIDGVAAGVVATLAVPQVTFLVGLMTASSLGSGAWAAVPFAPLVAGVLVVGLWRQRYADAVMGRRSPPWPLGVGLAVGLALGPSLSMNEAYLPLRPQDALQIAAWHCAWAGLLVVIVAPLASWVAEGASTTFTADGGYGGAGTHSRSVRWRCLLATMLTAFILAGLMYRLEIPRMFALMTDPGAGLDDVVTSPFRYAAGLLTPDTLRSPAHVTMLLAWLAIPWVALAPARGALKAGAAVGVVAGLAVPFLFVTTMVFAHDYPLIVRWPISFPFALERLYQHSAQVACVVAAIAAAVTCRRRPLAAGSAAAVMAALAGVATLVATRPVQSCVPALSTAPSRAPCPAFSSWGYVELIALLVPAGGLAATALLLPVSVALGQRLWRIIAPKAHGLSSPRLRTVAALAATTVALIGLIAVAHDATDRAAAATAGVYPGTIGDDGWATGPGFRARLVRGWLDTSQEPQGRLTYVGTQAVFEDTDGSGVIVVALGDVRSETPLSAIMEMAMLGPRKASLDGEPAVFLMEPGDPRNLDQVVMADHGGRRYAVYLYSTAAGLESDRKDLRTVLRSWQWTEATPRTSP